MLDRRRDTTVESVGSAPRIGDAAFRDVVVPAGANVQVRDEAGRCVGQVPQPEDGVPSLDPEALPGALLVRGAGEPRGAAGAPAGARRPDRQARARVSPGSDLAQRRAADLGGPARQGRGPRLLGRVERRLPRRPRPAQPDAPGPRDERPDDHRHPPAGSEPADDPEGGRRPAPRVPHLRRRPGPRGSERLGRALRPIRRAVGPPAPSSSIARGRSSPTAGSRTSSPGPALVQKGR